CWNCQDCFRCLTSNRRSSRFRNSRRNREEVSHLSSRSSSSSAAFVMKELAHNVAPSVEGTSIAPSVFELMGVAGSLKEKQADIWALVVAVILHTWGGASAATSLYDLGFFADAVRAETAARLETTVDIETTKQEEPEPAEPEPEPEPVVE